MTEQSEQMIEELVRAIQAEKYAWEFFRWASDVSSSESVKKIFKDFAKEEEIHQNLIKQQIERVSGEEWDISGFKAEKFPGLTLPSREEFVKSSMTEKDAISLGIKLEESAVKFYEALNSISYDKETRDFCVQFISFEKEHLKNLEKKLSEIKN